MDKHLFIEIIISEGARFLDFVKIEDHVVEYYTGPSGRKVAIYLDDETITKDNALYIIGQLGMDSLIQRMGSLL